MLPSITSTPFICCSEDCSSQNNNHPSRFQQIIAWEQQIIAAERKVDQRFISYLYDFYQQADLNYQE